MTTTEIVESLSPKAIEKIVDDPEKTARAIKLVYVNDGDPGITREKKWSGFTYFDGENKVTDEATLARIKSLVLPPAWEAVWICKKENGHLQATGLDIKKRKQYRYHPSWNALRSHTKFFRMQKFGTLLPAIRTQLEKDLSLQDMPQDKIMAAIVSLMERTNIRVGNNVYEKLYGSFGLTTLKNKHVAVNGTAIQFSFKGKKGVQHSIELKSKRLANIVNKCREIPGKELFQYIDENGEKHAVDSGMVNEYIKNICEENFTAKDFRTWAGTVHAFLALKEKGFAETETGAKKIMVEALDSVAKNLGNTRTVCKKYYVHPSLMNLYETGDLKKYFNQLDEIETTQEKTGLTSEEKIIMKILEKH
ncbi:MAG: DNA topoisomerase IB [Ferruginibacter sp.]